MHTDGKIHGQNLTPHFRQVDEGAAGREPSQPARWYQFIRVHHGNQGCRIDFFDYRIEVFMYLTFIRSLVLNLAPPRHNHFHY
jgi:hypothetical protein